MKKRTPYRSNRNVVIYQLTLKQSGQRYIGKTVANKRAFKQSMKDRFKGHVDAALKGRSCTMAEAIRRFGEESFSLELLEVVRGREAAKEREKQFIKNLDPSWDLNDCGLRKKGERLDVGTFDLVNACSLVA